MDHEDWIDVSGNGDYVSVAHLESIGDFTDASHWYEPGLEDENGKDEKTA